jgi:hypothetical protein
MAVVGFLWTEYPAVNQILDSLDEMQYLAELNDADISSVQSIFEDRQLHALLSVWVAPIKLFLSCISVHCINLLVPNQNKIWHFLIILANVEQWFKRAVSTDFIFNRQFIGYSLSN